MSWVARALGRALVMYLVLGLVGTAFGAVAFQPPQGTTWQEHATTAAQEIVTWPRVLPLGVAEIRDWLPSAL